MQKLICLALSASFALTGCGIFRSSPTWSTVRAVRVDTRGEADPSAAYAARLSEQLTGSSIEHQVVTYQFRYRNRHGEEAIATRTAVVYRDDTTPRYPWWLMDERLSQPFWLPSGDLAHQISFYMRTPVELVESASGASERSGKTIASPAADHGTSARAPIGKPGPAVALRGAPAPVRVRGSAVDLPERKRAWLQSRVADRGTAEARFRAIHGSAFNPLSSVDRRKMEQLRQGGRSVARAD